MKKIAIWGWWQGNNLGDNWIKKTLKDIFPYAEFIDTSIRDFSAYDFVICGGGGLFIYDVISPWKQYEQDVPFGIIGLGAEFKHTSDIARKLSEQAKFFYVRDQYSFDCMKLENHDRSYDITFARPLKWLAREQLDMNRVFFVWRDGQELLKDERFNHYIQYEDVKERWGALIGSEFKDIFEDDFQTKEDNIEERIAGCGFVVSGRYHGIMAAIQKGLPFVAIDICPKIRALVQECGLEEYCVKISEIDKVRDLIHKAKTDVNAIREKELQYRNKAQGILDEQIKIAKEEIFKAIKPAKVIHYGSYWMKENDVINTMSHDLQELCDLEKIDLKIYSKEADSRVKAKISTPNGCICVLDAGKVKEDIDKYHPDCMILNSGGMTMEDEAFRYAREKGVITVGISLSDPDVFPYNGQIYAYKFDLFYTNSKFSLENQYKELGEKVKCFPFAASPKHHYYMPAVKKEYDIVVVGHARPDRVDIVRRLSEKYKVGTYGGGWESSLGVVNGLEHVKAINSGKMYLSFAHTMAGYDNVKVGLFEAMACKQVVITSYMEELSDYFEIGKEILCYKNVDELEEIVDYYMKHEDEREEIRESAYQRFLREHTYEKRWLSVMEDIWAKSVERVK